MKRSISGFTALVLCAAILFGCVIQAGAVMPLPLKVGDVDRDNNVTSVDVTLIGRFLVRLQQPSELQIALSDTDGDHALTIMDMTSVQRYLAGMQGPFTGAEITDYVVGFASFHSDCEISIADHYSTVDICYIGVPVTFYPKAYGGARRYQLSIDGQTVRDISAKDYDEKVGLTYTFDSEGEYVVTCDAECRYGQHVQSSRRLRAVRLPGDDSPAVMGAVFYDEDYRGSGDGVLTVIAAGGSAPYQYCYTLYYDVLSPLCESSDNETPLITLPPSSGYTTGYIDDNVIDLPALFDKYVPKPSTGDPSNVMRVKITVRDADGKESQPVMASYIKHEIFY